MVWSVQLSSNNGKNFNYFNSSDDDMVKSALLQLNGHDRSNKEKVQPMCSTPISIIMEEDNLQ